MAIDFNNIYPWSEFELVIIDGQHMIKIPKYYVKYGIIPSGHYFARKKGRWVSKHKFPGYHIHPSFVKNGYVMDCFYIAAYEAHNAGDNKAGSAPNQTPWSINYNSAKTCCANRGEGWHLQNIYEVGATNILLLIELETPDVQTAIAAGNCYNAGTASGKMNTGSTDAIWRGIHEWWGNACESVDGIKTDANGIYQIFSNKMDGSYVPTGVTNPASGWITEMSEAAGTNFDLSDVFLPSETNPTETNGTYGDFHYTGNNTILYRKFAWNMGRDVGAFASDMSLSASATTNTGSLCFRLAKDGEITDEVA